MAGWAMGGMVERYRAELMPNGMVRVFDNETLSASVWKREVSPDGSGFKVECTSGPWVMDNDVWRLVVRAFSE